jgi:hypothetical protein
MSLSIAHLCLVPHFDETKCLFKIKIPFIAGMATAQPLPFTSISQSNLYHMGYKFSQQIKRIAL